MDGFFETILTRKAMPDASGSHPLLPTNRALVRKMRVLVETKRTFIPARLSAFASAVNERGAV